jgi:hypothetical protein
MNQTRAIANLQRGYQQMGEALNWLAVNVQQNSGNFGAVTAGATTQKKRTGTGAKKRASNNKVST